MPREANPRATIPDRAPAEPRRPSPVPHKPDADAGQDGAGELAVDPLAPGGSLFDEDDDAIEPNEPG